MIDGIKLVRVDFRLIHGQVITKWSNTVSAKEIVVINDQLSKDEYMAEIYIMAAPPGMKVSVLSINDFITQAKSGSYASGNILVLFKNIKDARDVVDLGISFKHVQIGGLGSGNGRTSVVKGISIDMEDIENLTAVQNSGTEVSFQVTPEEQKLSLEKASKKVRG